MYTYVRWLFVSPCSWNVETVNHYSKCILYQNRYILYFRSCRGLIKRPTFEYPFSPHVVNRTLLLVTIFLNTNKIIKGFSIMAYWHRPQKFSFVKSWSILSDLFRSSFTAVTQPAFHVRWGTNQNICWIAKETLFSPKQCAPSTGHKKPEKRQFLLQRHR